MTNCEFYNVESHEPPIVNCDMSCVPRIGEDVSLSDNNGGILDCRVVAVRHLPLNQVFEAVRIGVTVWKVNPPQ